MRKKEEDHEMSDDHHDDHDEIHSNPPSKVEGSRGNF
jgi:hypothetical protein